MRKQINIFDFDGTLTTETWPKFCVWIDKYGFDGSKRNEHLERALIEYSRTNNGDLLELFFGFLNKLLADNNAKITLAELAEGEKFITYNPGVFEFFKVSKVKNFIVSGGLLEFLQGLEIAKYFDGIYGTPARLDENGFMVGVGEVVTDCKKIPAILDILKKNGRDRNDCVNVNFIGDGASDMAAMRYVHENGGKAIFVHQPAGREDEWHEKLTKIYHELNADGIIDFRCVADFRQGSELTEILTRPHPR